MNATELIALGYRKLTVDDDKKIMGIDLENTVYFDTSITTSYIYTSGSIPLFRFYDNNFEETINFLDMSVKNIDKTPITKLKSTLIYQTSKYLQPNYDIKTIYEHNYFIENIETISETWFFDSHTFYDGYVLTRDNDYGRLSPYNYIYVKDKINDDWKKQLVVRNQSFVGRSNRDII